MRSAPAAWAKIGGGAPVAPKSMLPAFSASSSGGPEGNSDQVDGVVELPEPLLERAFGL